MANSITGFGLVISCSVKFILLYLPKSRRLTAMGREGVYIQVRIILDNIVVII